MGWITILGFLGCIFAPFISSAVLIGTKTTSIITVMLVLTGIIDLLFLARISSVKNGSVHMENAIKEHKKKIDELEKERDKIKKSIEELNKNKDLSSEKASKQRMAMADKLEAEKNKDMIVFKKDFELVMNKKNITNLDVFNEFRKNHYNKDIEKLLRKIEIKVPNINEKEIVKEGTYEDYQDFFENVGNEMTWYDD